MSIKILAREALSTLSKMTGTRHVLLDDAKELGGGSVLHGLSLDGRLYLVWEDEDNNQRVAAPAEWWDPTNLLESVDDPLPIISVGHLSNQELGDALLSEIHNVT